MRRRVLFVSKPIALPLHDGTKCVVRELAAALERHQAVVMTTHGATASELGLPRAELAAVYRDAGRFAPALAANARAALWL
ncbi:MAG: hypothetical protein FJW96_14650, partial [Actinobacteria bacterium]|nr:hypothetical protein [Actinomycetota bacterium]